VIADRWRAVVERATEAAVRAGRSPEEVTVVAAAKTFGVEAVREVVAAGARDIGENYVQEARAKARAVPEVRWHMIGRLQRNKARQAATIFQRIHSLDRIELAKALDAAAAEAKIRLRCLVEVKLGGEATKGGVEPAVVEALLGRLAALENLVIDGLMTIPPPAPARETRRRFAELRELRDRLRPWNVQLKELSMGMSADFEEAIAEGATMVRVGTAIFGPRG
jgi:PLP dependent protein